MSYCKRRIVETQTFHHAKNKPNLPKQKKTNPLKETKILQDIITQNLISSFNRSPNIIF
jgi:hypothetical protein